MYFLGSNDQGRTQGKNWLELLTSAPFTMKRHRQKKPKHSICLHPSSLKPYRIALKYQVETMSKRGKVRRKKYPRRGEDILHGENQSWHVAVCAVAAPVSCFAVLCPASESGCGCPWCWISSWLHHIWGRLWGSSRELVTHGVHTHTALKCLHQGFFVEQAL